MSLRLGDIFQDEELSEEEDIEEEEVDENLLKETQLTVEVAEDSIFNNQAPTILHENNSTSCSPQKQHYSSDNSIIIQQQPISSSVVETTELFELPKCSTLPSLTFDEEEEEKKSENVHMKEEEEEDVDVESHENEFLDYPDPKYLDVISDQKLGRKDLNRLKHWSYLIVLDKNDSSKWKLPYRDGLGRLNRPLLSRARQVLTSTSLMKELKILGSKSVLEHARKCFETAWPGQPVKLVDALDEPIVSIVGDSLTSTRNVIEEAKKLQERLSNRKSERQKKKSEENVVEVESDVAPTLLMKIRDRKTLAINKPKVISNFGGGSNGQTKNLRIAAIMKLADERERRLKSDQQVESEILPAVKEGNDTDGEAEEDNGKQEDKEDEEESPDEDYNPDEENEGSSEDGDDDDEEEEKEEEEEKGDEEEKLEAEQSVDKRIEQDVKIEEEQLFDVEQKAEEQNDVEKADTDLTPTELVIEDNNNADGEESNDSDSGGEEAKEEKPLKKSNNEAYRAILEADAKRSANTSVPFVDTEAAEEEEEDGVGNYGQIKEKVKGLDDADDDEDEQHALKVTEEDLKGIVDTYSDDEGDGDARDLFQKQEDERDEKMLRRVKRDVENHKFNESRKRLKASRMDRALNQVDDSDEETDEELEQAKFERYNTDLQSLATRLKKEDNPDYDESEEVPTRLFTNLKRSTSIFTSRQTTSLSYNPITQTEDEDSKYVLESLQSQPEFGFSEVSNSELSLSRSESLPPILRKTSSLFTGNNRGIATVSRNFVYTTVAKKETSCLEDDSAAMPSFDSTNLPPAPKRARTIPQVKRRVPFCPKPVNQLLSAKLLQPASLECSALLKKRATT